MTASATHAAAERLVSALDAARRGFAASDPVAANAALEVVVAACAELDAAGIRLDADTLQHARALHHACALAALPLQGELSAKLDQAAGARRAQRAYGR